MELPSHPLPNLTNRTEPKFSHISCDSVIVLMQHKTLQNDLFWMTANRLPPSHSVSGVYSEAINSFINYIKQWWIDIFGMVHFHVTVHTINDIECSFLKECVSFWMRIINDIVFERRPIIIYTSIETYRERVSRESARHRLNIIIKWLNKP